MKLGARLSIGATIAALLIFPTDTRAQGLTLEINNGLVTLQADAVPVRQILERWSQIVGMTVINNDTLPASPVTLQFANVPERQALETLLRDVRGYIVVMRQGVGAPIDRIVIAPARSMPLADLTGGSAEPFSTASESLRPEAVTPVQIPGSIRLDSSLRDGTDVVAVPEQERANGVPFVPPVPRTPSITEMPLGTAAQPPSAGPPVPPNPFGITSAATRFGAAAPTAPTVPAAPNADGAVTYRSGGDILPEEPRR